MREVESILRPEGTLHIVLGERYGLGSHIVGPTTAEGVKKQMEEFGYRCEITKIPIPTKNNFFDVQVRMASNTKQYRDESMLLERFLHYEAEQATKALALLGRHPITRHAQNYLHRCEEASQEHYAKTGQMPLLYSSTEFKPSIDMLTQGVPRVSAHVLKTDPEEKDCKLQLGVRTYKDRELPKTMEQMHELTHAEEGFGKMDLVHILSVTPLNSFTLAVQESLRAAAPATIEDSVERNKAFDLLRLARDRNSHRPVYDLIEQKRTIYAKKVPVVGEATIGHQQYAKHFPALIRQEFA
jgi:hypothetical protein